MKIISTVMLMLFVASASIAQTVYLPSGTGSITSSTSGYTGLGIGVSTPNDWLHVKSTGHSYLRLEKPSSSYQSGINFVKAGASQFYTYVDTDDALKFHSSVQSGESSTTPRLMMPTSNKNIYMALSGGKVGIGTNSPAEALHLKAATNSWIVIEKGSSSDDGGIQFKSTAAAEFNIWTDGGANALKMRGPAATSGDSDAAPRIQLPTDSGHIYMALSGGNVGIGTTSPDARLAVNGQVHATEVKVTTAVPGPDYVFDAEYNLPSLERVKSYIDQYHHLPEVPSAKEMELEGIKVGEMNLLLLKKVEELTLYVIELKNENVKAAKRLDDQAKKIEKLESKK